MNALSHTHTESHWARPDTVEELVDDLYKSYVLPKMMEKMLDPLVTCWLLLWDVHWSHRDADLISRLKTKYPTLVIMFVPACCTSLLQPLDVSFNSQFKQIIKSSAAKWMSKSVQTQIQAKIPPKNVVLP